MCFKSPQNGYGCKRWIVPTLFKYTVLPPPPPLVVLLERLLMHLSLATLLSCMSSKKYGVMACNCGFIVLFQSWSWNCCVCSLPIVAVHASSSPFSSPKMWIVDYQLFDLVYPKKRQSPTFSQRHESWRRCVYRKKFFVGTLESSHDTFDTST